MNCKILTTANGKVMDISLSPFEIIVLKEMAGIVSITDIVKKLNAPHKYIFSDVQAVGNVVRNFYNLLEK